MCEVCQQVGEEKSLKQRAKEIYKEFVGHHKEDYGRAPNNQEKIDLKQDALNEATYEAEEADWGAYPPGIIDQGVECCGVREMPARSALCEKGFGKIITQVAKKERFGFLFATTTQRQANEAAGLQARGFKNVGVFTNPNTGNTVTFWVYNIHPVKGKAKVKRIA